MDFETLIFGDEDPGLIKTQAPIQRPDPIARPAPVERPGSRAPAPPRFQFKPEGAPPLVAPAPQQAAPAEKPGMRSLKDSDLEDLIFGDGTPTPQRQAQAPGKPPPFPGFKPIEKEGWGEWFVNNVMGRKDPRVGDLPSIRSELEREYETGAAPQNFKAYWKTALGAALTADDEAQGNIVKSALGDRFIGLEKDAHGAVIVNYRDAGGLPKKAYVNRPGLEGEDIRDFIGQMAPYALMGRMVGGVAPGNGLMGMTGQGLGAGAVSLLQDTGAFLMGSEKAPDPTKAGVVGTLTAGVHGLAPIVGNLWRKFVTEPGLFNRSSGQLTPRGVEAAQKAGINPEDMTREISERFAQEYARTGSNPVVGRSVATQKFDIPVSRGELTKLPNILADEENMFRGNRGQAAQDIIKGHRDLQAQRIANAVGGDGPTSIARQIAPSRGTGNVAPVNIGENIQGSLQAARTTAKQIEDEAWAKVGPVYGSEPAFNALPRFTTEALAEMAPSVTKDTTPMTHRMLEILRKVKAGEPMHEADEFLGGAMQPELDTVRRSLLSMMKGAEGADKQAAGRVYGAYNKWLQSMEEQFLLNADRGSYEAMRAARDATAGWRGIFSERDFRGASEPSRRIVQNILDKTDSPEGIVRQLFGVTPDAAIRPGAVDAVRLIKRGVQTYLPEDQAKAVVDDLKLGYWLNLTKQGTGAVKSPTMLAQNIDKALQKQPTVIRELFDPDDVKLMRLFSAAMKDVSYKPPNPSGTSYNVAQFAGQAIKAFVQSLLVAEGPLAKAIGMVVASTPVLNTFRDIAGKAAATRTVNPRIPSGPIGPVGPLSPRTPFGSLTPIGAAITDARRERNR